MRDVTKILSDAEFIKLKELIAQRPTTVHDSQLQLDYPRVLVRREYVELQRLIIDTEQTNGEGLLLVKKAKEQIRKAFVVVDDIEMEEEYLAERDDTDRRVWFSSPADIVVDEGRPDPRIPTGRARHQQQKLDAADRSNRLRMLRREYASLTGRQLNDTEIDAAEQVAQEVVGEDEDDHDVPPVAKPTTKRERVAAAAQRSTSARRPVAHA